MAARLGRNTKALIGEGTDWSESLRALLESWTDFVCLDRNLKRRPKSVECYGPPEAAMILDELDSAIQDSPDRAHQLVQSKTIVQVVLLTGLRPSECLAHDFAPKEPVADGPAVSLFRPTVETEWNRKQTFFLDYLEISQVRRGQHQLKLNVEFIKGHTEVPQSAQLIQPVIPPITRLENMRFDGIVSLIPRLILDGVLYWPRAKGSGRYITNIDDFIRSESITFCIDKTSPRIPLFRRPRTDCPEGSTLSDVAMTVSDAAKVFSLVCTSAGLQNGRLSNFRRHAGDLVRIALGRECQDTVLDYGADHDPGRTSYSHAVADLGLARLVLGEFRPFDEERIDRIQSSEYPA